MDIHQISDLAAAYISAGLGESWAGGFLLSVAESGELPKGRGLTIASNLLEKGKPETWPNWNLAIDALDAASKCASKDDASTLRSIASHVRDGKILSEKQVKLALWLISSAEVPKNMKDLSDSDLEWLEGIKVKVSMTSVWYWSHRPGTHSRIMRALTEVKDQKQIFEESWEFLTKQFENSWKDWNAAQSASGELRKHDGEICLVIGERRMTEGHVYVSVIKSGISTSVNFNSLKSITRAPRSKKTSV